jgi:hypothetical protein
MEMKMELTSYPKTKEGRNFVRRRGPRVPKFKGVDDQGFVELTPRAAKKCGLGHLCGKRG